IGIAVVVVVDVLWREPQPTQRVRRIVGRNAHAVVGVDGVPVTVAAAPRDPHAAHRLEQRVERGDQASGRLSYDDRFKALVPVMLVRLAVADDDETPIRKRAAQDRVEVRRTEPRSGGAGRAGGAHGYSRTRFLPVRWTWSARSPQRSPATVRAADTARTSRLRVRFPLCGAVSNASDAPRTAPSSIPAMKLMSPDSSS